MQRLLELRTSNASPTGYVMVNTARPQNVDGMYTPPQNPYGLYTNANSHVRPYVR